MRLMQDCSNNRRASIRASGILSIKWELCDHSIMELSLCFPEVIDSYNLFYLYYVSMF
ncbi:hypothetical protein RchiOBHm_Chr5g0054601 [Rosa chinensis]|uniref:Uncharacterized protein n=1 Tax=Rosa chinensis TaxID=74649 RepID=A0A2P6QG71_ROSCH|nr:hypothetical protein RchiOBHm_Chr5g0054601 [Rosa chinensis]